MLLDAARPLSLLFFVRLEAPAVEEDRIMMLDWGCMHPHDVKMIISAGNWLVMVERQQLAAAAAQAKLLQGIA
jgi:hypothetical protein